MVFYRGGRKERRDFSDTDSFDKLRTGNTRLTPTFDGF
jgi:hypothetical protein